MLWSHKYTLSFKDLPESRGVLITLLLVTMGHTVLQEGVALDRSGEAVTAAYTIFGLSCVLLTVILITHLVVMTLLVYRFEGCGINIIFSFILQSLGAVLYFIGDNLSKLVNRYNKSLKTANEVKIAGTVCIAIALVFFLFVPQISHLLFDAKKMCVKTKKAIPKTEIILVKPANDEHYEQASKDKKFDDKLWCTAIDTITVILKVDVLYSAVMAMTTASENVCSERDKYLSISIYVLLMVLGCTQIITASVVSQVKKDQAYTYKCGMTVAFVLIVVSYPLHILMNNSLPLDCAFVLSEANETDISTINLNNTNITTATSMSNQVGNSITRLVISAITFITLTTISTLFGCAYVTKLLESLSIKSKTIPSYLERTHSRESRSSYSDIEHTSYPPTSHWQRHMSSTQSTQIMTARECKQRKV